MVLFSRLHLKDDFIPSQRADTLYESLGALCDLHASHCETTTFRLVTVLSDPVVLDLRRRVVSEFPFTSNFSSGMSPR